MCCCGRRQQHIVFEACTIFRAVLPLHLQPVTKTFIDLCSLQTLQTENKNAILPRRTRESLVQRCFDRSLCNFGVFRPTLVAADRGSNNSCIPFVKRSLAALKRDVNTACQKTGCLYKVKSWKSAQIQQR